MNALVLALTLLLVAISPAQAGFLVPIILGTAFAATAAGIALTFAVNVVAGFALSFAAQKLLGQEQQTPVGGAELDLRADPDTPEVLLLGRVITAGSLAYAEAYGKRGDIDNSDLVQIIACADHPCQGFVTQFADEKEVTFTAAPVGTPGRTYSTSAENRGFLLDDYNGRVAIQFYTGTQTTADAFAVAALGTHPERPYTATRIGRNRTYVRMHYIYHQETITAPIPLRFVIDGIKLYDPRLDTTVGGSGAHRWSDLDTHTFTRNPVVIAYNILRGIRVKDSTGTAKHFYGLENTPAANLPLTNWFAAMNECDVVVDDEPQYQMGAEIPVSTEPLEVIKQIVKLCDGRFTELGGVYYFYVGAPGLPVISFDDGLLSGAKGDQFNPILPLEQRINYITAKYTSPEEGWVPKIAPPRTDAAMEAADGRRLSADLDLPMVQSASHIQRLQQQMLRRSRRERRHVIPLPQSCFGLIIPGEHIEWNSDRNGYVDKLFEVESFDIHLDLSLTVSMIEVDPDDYDWNAGTDLIVQPVGSLTVNRPDPKIIEGFTVTAIPHEGDTGAARPAILVSWDVPADGDLIAVDIEVRRTAEPTEVMFIRGTDVEFEAALILNGIAPVTQYDVRAKFVSANGYETSYSLWVTVTTPDTRFTRDELEETLDALLRRSEGEFIRLIDEARKEIDVVAASLQGIGSEMVERDGVVIRSLGARTANAEALVQQAFVAIADDMHALGAFMSTVQARFGEATATVEEIQLASSSPDAATAAFMLRLLTNNGANSADGFIRFIAASTATGATASFAVEINVGTFGTPDWRKAGIYLDAMAGFSRIRFVADQLRIGLTNTEAGDLVFESMSVDGVTKAGIRSLVIGDLTVLTRAIEHEGVTVPVFASLGSHTTLGGTFTDLFDFNLDDIDSDDAISVIVMVMPVANYLTASANRGQLRVRVNDDTIITSPIFSETGVVSDVSIPNLVAFTAVSGTGAPQDIRIRLDGISIAGSVAMNQATQILAIALKR